MTPIMKHEQKCAKQMAREEKQGYATRYWKEDRETEAYVKIDHQWYALGYFAKTKFAKEACQIVLNDNDPLLRIENQYPNGRGKCKLPRIPFSW